MVMGSAQNVRSERLGTGFERFVAATSPGLLRAAYVLSGDRDDAEDLLQGALLRTLRRWDAIDGSPAAYAFRVLVNLSHDRERTRRRRPSLALQAEIPERPVTDQVERLLEREAVTQAARRLPEVQRQVLASRFLLDLSVAETAAALDLPEGTVKSYTARALARIRELLAEKPIPTSHESPDVRRVD
jgi:RNA polymerase sigma-70 factor (sigma-E family)